MPLSRWSAASENRSLPKTRQFSCDDRSRRESSLLEATARYFSDHRHISYGYRACDRLGIYSIDSHTSLIEEQKSDISGDLSKMQEHRLGIAFGQDECRAISVFGRNRAENIG
jgi:hypothetical protein